MKKRHFKRIQKQLGLSIREIANLLGVKRVTIEKWRSGANRITQQTETQIKMYLELQKMKKDNENKNEKIIEKPKSN